MIEIFTSGFFVGRPHQIGGGGAVIHSERQEIGRVKRVFQAGEVGTSIAAELVVLAEALEKAREQGGSGEDVIVRTGYAAMADLCRGGVARSAPELQELVERLGELATSFSEIRALVSPGWVTARPHDLAVRAVLDLYRKARTGSPTQEQEVEPGAPA